jgi:hypothetical protein
MVRVISCVKGTGLNAGYWVITYEDPSRIGAVGSGLSLVPWQVGTFISKSSLR